jgi:hypothetical protein
VSLEDRQGFESLSAPQTASMAEFEGKSVPAEESEEKEEEEDTTLANPDVTTKYQEAAKIANSTLSEIIALVWWRRLHPN